VIGVLCIVPLGIGIWLKRVARQASEFGERVVEAQYIGQTKALKRQRSQEDNRLLFERAVGPELALRAGDDSTAGTVAPRASLLDVGAQWGVRKFHEGELAFLRVVELMYLEFLDGSPFHRSDAKTATQLLGSLAVLNLRRTNPRQFRAERRRWEALDLNKSSGLFGGPYLWFSYINRLLSQETATLMLDYNLNAQPLDRLPALPKAERDAYRAWLARRKGVRLEEILEIAPYSPAADEDPRRRADSRTRREPLFDNVQFSALDILVDDPGRDAQIRSQYGEDVAELLQRDRRELIRRAFRTFPLHELPRERRTINPLQMYQNYAADGRILLLPFRMMWWLLRGGGRLWPAAYRSVRQLLRPAVATTLSAPVDSYAVAVRKIHRMRKPMFLTALWLRANFDVEYLGLRLPGVPTESEATSPLERDLDFIEASHFDRLNAERVRVRRATQLRAFAEALAELKFDFEALANRLKVDFPPLVERRGEVVRALVAAGMADYDDVRSLASSVSGLRAVMAYAADARNDLSVLPPWIGRFALDQPPTRRWWFNRRSVGRLFRCPCFPDLELWQQRRVQFALGRHRRLVGPWIDVLLAEGGADPMGTLEDRLLDIVRRVDLWSDEIVALRTLQTMTILDVDHYGRFVWELGRYAELGEMEAPQAPTGPAVPRYSRNGAGGLLDETATLTALE
jgi:hypothetical protein